jgi:hypothetical protein
MASNDYSASRKPLEHVLVASAAGMIIPSTIGTALIIMRRYEGLIFNRPEFIVLAVIALVSAVVFAITVSIDLQKMGHSIRGESTKEQWEVERMQRTLQSVQKAHRSL